LHDHGEEEFAPDASEVAIGVLLESAGNEEDTGAGVAEEIEFLLPPLSPIAASCSEMRRYGVWEM